MNHLARYTAPKYLLNFADEKYRATQILANQMASMFGVSQVISYQKNDLPIFEEFYKKNINILSQARGCGYWLWKPFLIRETLASLKDGEILLYCDSGVLLKADTSALFDICNKHEQAFFELTNCPNKAWVKRDCFISLGCDNPVFWNKFQVTGQCHLWKKCSSSFLRLAEWLSYCEQAELLTDTATKEPNLEDFIEHRHDQAILSLLVTKWGLEVFRNPSSNGNDFIERYPNSPYDEITISVGRIETNEFVSSQLKTGMLEALKALT